jgi:glycosyltransferase involved in cell wall biosynthesis
MTFTCIIPFFNERDRILNVLDEVVKIKSVNQILLVDDGSTDGTAEQVKKHYPNLSIIYNKKNLGKSEAIAGGLKIAKGDYIILLDADLQNFLYKEIEDGITAIKKDKNIDMIIFNRINAPFIVKLSRGSILTCGQRIIKKEALVQTFSLYKPKGYQIEFALNQYMMDKQKEVYWMPISAGNTKSTEKRGFSKGMQKIIRMHIEIFGYLGIYNAFKELLFFCRKEYKIT